MSDPEVLVACLCADWCGVCRDYAAVFARVGAHESPSRFVWVDVEDHADLLDPVEVDNFPTLLIAVGGEPRFFGVLTPQQQMLERIVRECTVRGDAALAGRADLRALVQRVQELA